MIKPLQICNALLAILIIISTTISLQADEYDLTAAKRIKWNEYRVAIGTGFTLYAGSQRGGELVFKYGNRSELVSSYTLQVYKLLDEKSEIGGRYMYGNFFTMKSNRTLATYADFHELSFNYQGSTNANIDLMGIPFTFNYLLGLGLINYRSAFVYANELDADQFISGVGYGPTATFKNLPNRQFAGIVNGGVTMGFRISPAIAIYWENIATITTTNKLSGNLFRTAFLPPDAYFYSGLSLSFKLDGGSGRLGCARF